MRVLGSLAIHAVLLALLLVVGNRERTSEPTVARLDIEVVPAPRLVEASGDSGGGSTRASRAAEADRAKPVEPQRRVTRATRRTTRAPSPSSIIGDIRYEANDSGAGESRGDGRGDGNGAGDGRGNGNGAGDGRGNGIGLGSGGHVAPPPPLAPPPGVAVEQPSKARPPKLIYPARHRDVEESELFVARVAIDRDGYVVGAKLVRGAGHRADQASSLIFRFRYAPALDDAGRAIAATIEQPFGVD